MMKNKLKKLIPVMLVAMLSLSLVDCSCSEPARESESAAETTTAAVPDTTAESKEASDTGIAGRYEIIAMISEGKETTDEDLALMKSKGLNCTITLNSNGTGVLDLFGEESALTWDDATISTAEKEYQYSCEGEQLTVTNGDSTLTFSKTE